MAETTQEKLFRVMSGAERPLFVEEIAAEIGLSVAGTQATLRQLGSIGVIETDNGFPDPSFWISR